MTEPVIAQKGPFPVDMTAGETYWWCRCGLSANQPLCDGSHAETDIEPVEYTATETTTGWLCGCKRTATPPFCDGSHQDLA